MPTVKDVVDFARQRKFVTVAVLSEEFDLSTDKACRVLKACWDRGLLAPTDMSWFTIPGDDGLPLKMRSARGATTRSEWHKKSLDAIRAMVADDPTMALTVRDVEKELDTPNVKARNALKLLVELGELVSREAAVGGLYGKRPVLFGVDEAAIAAREDQIELERKAKTAERKAAEKARKKKPQSKTKVSAKSDGDGPEALKELLIVPLYHDEP